MEITVENIVKRWSGLERPLFKGKLIDAEGCKCAQGDVLSCAGWTDDALRNLDQQKADAETAKLLGISLTHSILLRQVNDAATGAPQIVLTDPAQVLGPHVNLVLGLWLSFDALTDEQLGIIFQESDKMWGDPVVVAAAREAEAAAMVDMEREVPGKTAERDSACLAWAVARLAAWEAWSAARAARAAEAAAWRVASAAGFAELEIIGMDTLIADKKEPHFLAFFGFDTWDKVREISNLYPWRKSLK